jgi:hypothetical protein
LRQIHLPLVLNQGQIVIVDRHLKLLRRLRER